MILYENLFSQLVRPWYWKPRFLCEKHGSTWHGIVRVPVIVAGKLQRWRTFTGIGTTRKAALSDVRRAMNKAPALLRAAYAADMMAAVGDAVGDFTRSKMREDGIMRRLFPIAPEHEKVFVRWGKDGKAVFRYDPFSTWDRDGKVLFLRPDGSIS